MPELVRFDGIVITIHFNEGKHNTPHVHVRYGGSEASYALNGTIITGQLPPKQSKIVAAWIVSHEKELQDKWEKAKAGKKPKTNYKEK